MRRNGLQKSYLRWRHASLNHSEGILVGANLSQQWILPWWWENYSRHNSYPVAFVDLGMTEEMRTWCLERGEWIRLPVSDVFVAEKDEIEPSLVSSMEKACGTDFWPSRKAWFKKPLACLQSPFQHTLWIDLDCQILASLTPLFSLSHRGIAMARETFHSSEMPLSYNAGVILFEYKDPLIEAWAEYAVAYNHEFRGDQDALNALIAEQKRLITEIPEIYNWSRCHSLNPQAAIVHWHGPHGKTHIAHQIAKANLQSLFN